MSKENPRHTPRRDDKYMGLAWMMASFSKDPRTQVGALIIEPKSNRALGWGYNGPPSEISDDKLDWARPNKYDWVIHAEENAIDHSPQDIEGTHLYVTHMPCKRCMLRIVNKKIARVVFTDYVVDAKSSTSKTNADVTLIKEIAKDGGVKLEAFEGNIAWIQDWILDMKSLGVFEI